MESLRLGSESLCLESLGSELLGSESLCLESDKIISGLGVTLFRLVSAAHVSAS